jgi:hypothetical protein
VDDALTDIDLVVIVDAELGGVLGQRVDLKRTLGVINALGAVVVGTL